MRNLKQKIGKLGVLALLGYSACAVPQFFGTSQGIREIDNKYELTKEQRMLVNSKSINKYNNSSLPHKILNVGEYLAYQLYQENLSRGLVEGL